MKTKSLLLSLIIFMAGCGSNAAPPASAVPSPSSIEEAITEEAITEDTGKASINPEEAITPTPSPDNSVEQLRAWGQFKEDVKMLGLLKGLTITDMTNEDGVVMVMLDEPDFSKMLMTYKSQLSTHTDLYTLYQQLCAGLSDIARSVRKELKKINIEPDTVTVNLLNASDKDKIILIIN